MGLAKDIYDILSSEPELKKAVQKGLLKYLNPGVLAKWFGHKPTDSEQISQQKALIEKFTEPDFSGKFRGLLDYFGVLIATIVLTAHLKHRGALVKNFFGNSFYLYFPTPSNEPKLVTRKNKISGKVNRALQVGKENELYSFYAFTPSPSTQDINFLRQELSKIVRRGETSEVEGFLSMLKGHESIPHEIQGIAQVPGQQLFELLPRNALDFLEPDAYPRLRLSFENANQAKQSIKESLEEVLAFKLV